MARTKARHCWGPKRLTPERSGVECVEYSYSTRALRIMFTNDAVDAVSYYMYYDVPPELAAKFMGLRVGYNAFFNKYIRGKYTTRCIRRKLSVYAS